MASLRTVSSRRLIAGIGGAVVLVVAGVGVGVAVSGATAPAPQPLADALHQAAAGTKPTGITADVTFTNNLLSDGALSGLPGVDPLISGASGRLWADTAGNLRIELQNSGGGTDSQIEVTPTTVTVYDGTQNTVYTFARPASTGTAPKTTDTVPTVTQIQDRLNQLATHLDIVGAIPGTDGNVPSYSAKISPKHDGGLLGDVQLAWDASNGVPLGISVYSTQDPSSPVLALKVNDIAYGPVDAASLHVSPPADAKVVNMPAPTQTPSSATKTPAVTGLSAVQAQVGFPISAPATVDGLAQHEVRLVDWKGTKAALVTYGQGLGGIAVLERPATTAKSGASPLDQLPKVTVAGVSGHELATPLGTIVTFDKGGVSYTIAGSVLPLAAETAAGDLS